MLGKGSGSQFVPGTGNCGQSGEINTASISGDCLSGNQDQFADFQGFSDSLEDRKVLLNSRRISVLKGAVCEVLEGSVGPLRVSDAPCSEWSALHESLATGSKVRLGFSGRGDPGSRGRPFSRRSSVVVRRGSSRRGGFLALRSPDQMFWSDASDLMVSYLPHFVAKTERADAPVTRNFRILSLQEFPEDLEEGSLLCPMRALTSYLRQNQLVVVRAHSLFLFPRSPSRPISRNVVSFFLREVISEAGAVRDNAAPPLRAHSVRGLHFCIFSQELVDLQCAGGCNLEVELSFCLFLF